MYKRRDDGTDQTIHDLLRSQAREKAGRLADHSLVVLDTQSLHVVAVTTGRDAAKKVPGRKRGLAVDVLNLVTAVVLAAPTSGKPPRKHATSPKKFWRGGTPPRKAAI
ncbi:hypothetical protein [Streptomyces sp. NPDC088801]|uniref:hypothetical protein n=1 Tax=Streptomyces sp. NPDC088801 TaxID=3365903 RepID=UPI003818BD4F